MKEPVIKLMLILIAISVIIGILLWGPYCLAYDINMINKYFANNIREVSMWEPPILICGVIFSELSVPISFGIWLFHSIGWM